MHTYTLAHTNSRTYNYIHITKTTNKVLNSVTYTGNILTH